jgi:cytochrome c2
MEGYRYSAEFKKGLDGQKWTPELLDAWLADPQELASGTYMMYKQNDAAVRKNIIEYLKSIK